MEKKSRTASLLDRKCGKVNPHADLNRPELLEYTEPGEFMPRPPNYKQEKKRREDAQKRRNEQEQQRKTERKNLDTPLDPTPR